MNTSESPTTIASKINWVDMAAVYGLGHSGEVVERALKTASQKPHVFTKCGLVWGESARW